MACNRGEVKICHKHSVPIQALATTFLVIFVSVSAWAQGQGWEKEWNATLAAAKKEGKVVVVGTPDSTTRRELPKQFKAKFGIPVEWISMRSSQVAAKMGVERRVGLYSLDVLFGGMNLGNLYNEKILDPIKPLLMLPDVVDPSKWKKGKLWFVDPEERYILRLFNFISDMFHFNTRYVKLEEFRTVKDLLNPKWKGKITADDPTVPGPGMNTAAVFYRYLGEDFVKKLYIDQKPVISRNRRMHADWMARGTYPIALDASSGEVKRLKKEGFPLESVHSLPGAPGRLSAGGGLLALVNKAPHPNAARIFINWIASKEGLEAYSRARLIPTTRNDVDESFLAPEMIPQLQTEYFDIYEWNFYMIEREKIRSKLKELLRR